MGNRFLKVHMLFVITISIWRRRVQYCSNSGCCYPLVHQAAIVIQKVSHLGPAARNTCYIPLTLSTVQKPPNRSALPCANIAPECWAILVPGLSPQVPFHQCNGRKFTFCQLLSFSRHARQRTFHMEAP